MFNAFFGRRSYYLFFLGLLQQQKTTRYNTTLFLSFFLVVVVSLLLACGRKPATRILHELVNQEGTNENAEQGKEWVTATALAAICLFLLLLVTVVLVGSPDSSHLGIIFFFSKKIEKKEGRKEKSEGTINNHETHSHSHIHTKKYWCYCDLFIFYFLFF